MNSGQEKIFKTHQLNDVDDCVRSIKSVIEKTKKLPKSDFVRHVLSCSVLAFSDLLDELGYAASVQNPAITKQHNSCAVKKIFT